MNMYMDISMDPKKVILNELIHIIENIAFDKYMDVLMIGLTWTRIGNILPLGFHSF